MTDHFSVLHQLRRPWLDAEALKEEFHREAAAHHPDVNGGEGASRFVALNAAYSALREPAARLRHFLELEAPDRLSPSQVIPAALGDLFMKVAELRQTIQAHRKKESAALSALGVSLLAQDRLDLAIKVKAIHDELVLGENGAIHQLRQADSDWDKNPRPSDIFDRLGALYHQLVYLAKWLSQITEILPSLLSAATLTNKSQKVEGGPQIPEATAITRNASEPPATPLGWN